MYRPLGISHHDVRDPCRARCEGELLGEITADGHDEIDADLCGRAPDLTVGFNGFVAQLQHLSEYGDPPAARGLGRLAVRGVRTSCLTAIFRSSVTVGAVHP
ncbi:hypothetical protein [Streptomyces alanosinicus]|uniref:Uncharacterized protein n=1 Tax=Streptomyces alanosinicus TaxID=68171 RepID=A0A918MHA4_9ACTN|nr:hypothetical protein GCM10010339_94000 [Streptomyces alanosinicus]